MQPLGLYIHVPFCTNKCPYCDFYSLTNMESVNDYIDCIISNLYTCEEKMNRSANTLYFGGGTPSVIGAERLGRVIDAAKESFGLQQAEITVEVNPSSTLDAFFDSIAEKGVNRISMGMQSAHRQELTLLGRRHSAQQAWDAVEAAHRAGITNVSMDLMVGIQKQTEQSLKDSIAFCSEAGASHISAYLLKVEPNTPYGAQKENLLLPDDDKMGDLYLMMVEELKSKGFYQYEISNFAKKDKNGKLLISKHNTKYWQGEEYLGLGPSAHSFINGKRYYFDRSVQAFIQNPQIVEDGSGGSKEEYAMLALRLISGLSNRVWQKKFGEPLPPVYVKRAQQYQNVGLVKMHQDGFAFTPKGFLVSNQLIYAIIFDA